MNQWFGFGTGMVSVETIGTMAQVLPALAAVSVLVPILGRMPSPPDFRWFVFGQVLVTVLGEGLLVWFVIEGQPVVGGWRAAFFIPCLYAFIMTIALTIGWAVSERDPFLAQIEDEKAAEWREEKDARDVAALLPPRPPVRPRLPRPAVRRGRLGRR